MKFVLHALAIVVSLLTAPAAAQDFERGKTALLSDDYAAALQVFQPLAEQGHGRAQAWLGVMYGNGIGVPQDFTEALKWYRTAAENGEVMGKYQLGIMYDTGEGVPQDYVLAYMWYNLAAAQGFFLAKHWRDLVVEKMTPDQIAAAQRKARDWLDAHPQ